MPTLDELNQFYSLQLLNQNRQYKDIRKHLFHFASSAYTHWKKSFLWSHVHLFLNSDQKIMQFGSIDMTLAYALKKKGFHISFLEPLTIFKEEIKKKGFHILDDESKDTQDLVFDVCLLIQTFQLFENPLEILRKLHALLKPGGILLGFVPNVSQSIDLLSEAMKMNLFNNPALFHFSPTSIKLLLEEAQFKDIDCKEYGFSKKGIRKIFPQANYHFLKSEYESSLGVKLKSYFHLLECFLRPSFAFAVKEGHKGFQEPNDQIFFIGKA